MNWQKRIISGLGIGSFIFLLTVLINGKTVVTDNTVLFVFAISIFAALTSSIFNWERIKSFWIALCIHYFIMLIFIVCAFKVVYEIKSIVSLLLSITVMYAFTYVVTIIKTKMTARELNTYLKQQNHESDTL